MKAIVDEIKQTRPFPDLESEAMVSLARTFSLIEHGFGEILKPHGITLTLYNILRILRGAGEAGLCRYEIADRMINPAPDVTRLLDRLERKGLVTRERDLTNRRQVKTTITHSGLNLLKELDQPVLEFNARVMSHLGERRLRAFIDALASARENL